MLRIYAYQCGQKMKSIFLETTYFSGMVCPVGVLAPAKMHMSDFRLSVLYALGISRVPYYKLRNMSVFILV
jgi:hypothetical protein